MKNKILLLYPKFHKVDFDAKSYPLGLMSIGTILEKEGYIVKMIDFLVEDSPYEILKKELDDDVLVVGISAMTPQIPSALEISKLVKEYNKNIPIVWGGIHGTLFPEQTISNNLIDYLIVGEGEISFSKLLNYLKGGETQLNDIGGLAYKVNGQIHKNSEKELIDLNDLPMLNYSFLSPKTLSFDSIILNTSRGCPYRCTFCVNIALHNRAWRYQKADKVLDQIEYIVNTLGYKRVKFQEDNFFVSKDRVEAILNGIKERGLKFKWITNCRVDYFRDNYINDEFLEKLKEAGCDKLMFGAESGSERVLNFLKKDITVEKIMHSARLCQRHSVQAVYSFICAIPTETKKERIKTLNLIDDLIAIGDKINIISPQPYRPYPGDELARKCEEMGYRFPDKLEDWPAVVAKSMDSSSSNLEDFPWIDNPNEIRLQRICSIMATNRKTAIDYIKRYPPFLAPLIIPFYLVEKLRWKYKFFSWPLEYGLFMKLYWGTQKLRKKIFIKKTIKNKEPKVLYVFAGQRKNMEKEWLDGKMPDTYFIGMNHMGSFGIDAEYIETDFINRLRKVNFNLANIFLLFKMRKYDIVFTGASIFFIFLAKVVFRFSKPKFVYYNTSLTNLYKRNNKGLRKWIVRKTIKSLDAIICPSTVQRDFLIKKGFNKEKIYFIANGVDVDFISTKTKQTNSNNNEKHILSVGKDMGRDYKTLIEAVKDIDIKVKIVAAPRNIDSINNLPPNISFETLPFIDLLELYSNCEFVVIPTRKENYLNASDCSGQYVLLDSMASSKAVVASGREALSDYFIDGENGIMVEPENTLELKNAIEKLLNNKLITEEMEKKSFERVLNNFTTKIFAENLANVFKSIVDKKK